MRRIPLSRTLASGPGTTTDNAGIVVYSDGRRYWNACFETGELKGFTTDPQVAVGIRATVLLEYERITHFDTMQGYNDEEGYDPSQVAFPALVEKCRELLDALAENRGELPSGM